MKEFKHQEVLLQIRSAVQAWFSPGNTELPVEMVEYLAKRPEKVEAKVWDKQLAYFLKLVSEATDGLCKSHPLPDGIQNALVTRIIRDPQSVEQFVKYLRCQFFSSRNLAAIRKYERTYSYLKWYQFSLNSALLFWQRLEDERNNNPFSTLVPDMEGFAKKYLAYHPVMQGFIEKMFDGVKDPLTRTIISQEVSTLIEWSAQKFPTTDVKSVIDYCDTVDFIYYLHKFGLTKDEQMLLILSAQKAKIFAYIDEVGRFDEDVYSVLSNYKGPEIKGREDILGYYRNNSAEPLK